MYKNNSCLDAEDVFYHAFQPEIIKTMDIKKYNNMLQPIA
jgi:hypothetical protein